MQRMMLRGRGGGEEERFQVESGLRVFPVALAFDVLDSASVTVEDLTMRIDVANYFCDLQSAP